MISLEGVLKFKSMYEDDGINRFLVFEMLARYCGGFCRMLHVNFTGEVRVKGGWAP